MSTYNTLVHVCVLCVCVRECVFVHVFSQKKPKIKVCSGWARKLTMFLIDTLTAFILQGDSAPSNVLH